MNQTITSKTNHNAIQRGLVLIVDDDSLTRKLYQTMFTDKFEFIMAASGQEALDMFAAHKPDLVLLDIEMPFMNGYEVCTKLREFSSVPIIFVTSHQSIEEHMSAYNAGGNDIITKPIEMQIILHKVSMALKNHFEQTKLLKEKASLQGLAHSFYSTADESGILLNFMRASLACVSYPALAEKFIAAAQEFGIECCVLIRFGKGKITLTTHGEPTSLEQSILEQSASMGKELQFKNRLVINHERICILVSNLPSDDDEKVRQIRDNIATLAETTAALIETVEMRHESMARPEKPQPALHSAIAAVKNLRTKAKQNATDACMLLQDLIHNVEKTYSSLDTSKKQESVISSTLQDSVQRVLNVLALNSETEQDFEQLLQVLRGNNKGF